MKYLGGKSRISKKIHNVILENCRNINAKTFVSLFCGAGSIEVLMAPHFDKIICNDAHKYLIALWQALQDGWIPPENLSKEEYLYIKNHKEENPALTAFAGFGCSYGGMFFSTYARDSVGTNYAACAKKGLLRDIEALKDATFICADYRDVKIPKESIVYADPPYRGTRGYTTGNFDSDEFWKYMRQISKDHLVFISEQSAPDDFECIWEIEVKRILNKNKGKAMKEKLFKYRN